MIFQSRPRYDFEVVGGMRGAALELVHCKTIDVDVPARTELVFELEIDFTQQAFEGPLGEFTEYYTPGSKKPIARIKAITHRNDAYFQALLRILMSGTRTRWNGRLRSAASRAGTSSS